MISDRPNASLLVTGHRPGKIGGYGPAGVDTPMAAAVRAAVRGWLQDRMARWNIRAVYSGMALGVDTIAAQEAVGLGLPLIAAVPYAGHAALWHEDHQDVWERLTKAALRKVIVSNEPGWHPGGSASPADFLKGRNQWMVTMARRSAVAEVLAVWNGSPSGTEDCIRKAQAAKIPVLVLNPMTMSWGTLGS